MSVFSKIVDFLGGGIVESIADTVKEYFPPSMSEVDKAKLEFAIREAEHKNQVELLRIGAEADAEFNKRIVNMEGTASDLKTVPYFGGIVIFLRGCQRPVWGFFTMYADVIWFTGSSFTDKQETGLIIINVLVLTFLFGERAAKNIMPLIMSLHGKGRR